MFTITINQHLVCSDVRPSNQSPFLVAKCKYICLKHYLNDVTFLHSSTFCGCFFCWTIFNLQTWVQSIYKNSQRCSWCMPSKKTSNAVVRRNVELRWQQKAWSFLWGFDVRGAFFWNKNIYAALDPKQVQHQNCTNDDTNAVFLLIDLFFLDGWSKIYNNKTIQHSAFLVVILRSWAPSQEVASWWVASWKHLPRNYPRSKKGWYLDHQVKKWWIWIDDIWCCIYQSGNTE